MGRTRKLTGTRFAAVLGKNRWKTPFEIWADITNTYKEPFESTIYTEAGKHIEPLQMEWYKENYFANIMIPEDRYGFDPYSITYGNFFGGLKASQLSAGDFDDPSHEILGGMWDGLELDGEGNPIGVIEAKSTKRAQDWTEDQAPEYYEYQAALYAHLLGLDRVTMIVTFLDEEDYHGADNSTRGEAVFEALDKMKKSLVVSNDNTFAFTFKISERYPHFKQAVDYAVDWFNKYVKTGKSPDFDMSTRDKDIIRQLTTEKIVDPEMDITQMAKRADEMDLSIRTLKALNGITQIENELKALKEDIKNESQRLIKEDQNYVEVMTEDSIYTISRETRTGVDTEKLKTDGLYELYSKQSETIVLRKKENKI